MSGTEAGTEAGGSPARSTLPETFLMSLDGTEEEAQAFAARELDRIAADLDRSGGAASPKEDPAAAPISEVFTAYLLPASDDYDPRTLREDLIPIHFPWSDPARLADCMRREVDYLYTVSGESGPLRLDASIIHTLGAFLFDQGTDPDFPWRNLVPFASREQAREAARLTGEACEDAISDVLKRARATLPTTQQAAAALADANLTAARSEIYTEAARYLDISGPRRATAQDILTRDADEALVLLKGPGVAALAGALRRIHERRRALEVAVGIHEAARDAAAVGPAGGATAAMAATTAADVEAAAHDLTLTVTVEAAAFPILHRIWQAHDLPEAVIAAPGQDGDATLTTARRASWKAQNAAGTAIAELKHAIWHTLRRSWQANGSFAAALSGDPERVWRYAPLIANTLEQLDITDPSVAFRAAQDRLVDEAGMSLIATLNLVSAALSTAAWLTAAAPPVALVLAVTGAILGLADTVQDYLKRVEQNEAFNAVLDPSKAVAAPTGYLGIVVAVAFTVLDIKGVKDAFTVARLGRAGAAATATQLVAP
jgi:hypothetical protein